MLTTGIDAPTCKNIVLFKPINSIVDFKQIIGRGTRVREDFGKLWFTIIDYTGATALFADPAFDGVPERPPRVETINTEGEVIASEEITTETAGAEATSGTQATAGEPQVFTEEGYVPTGVEGHEPRKSYVDNVLVWITAEQAFELDPDGHVLKTMQYTHYPRDQIRRLLPTADHLRIAWPEAQQRAEITAELAKRGVDFDMLAKAAHQPDADPLDLLLHVAYNAPSLTRRERVQQLKAKRANFFKDFTLTAREVLEVLLDKYADYGFKELTNWNALLNIPPSFRRRHDVGDCRALRRRAGDEERRRADAIAFVLRIDRTGIENAAHNQKDTEKEQAQSTAPAADTGRTTSA